MKEMFTINEFGEIIRKNEGGETSNSTFADEIKLNQIREDFEAAARFYHREKFEEAFKIWIQYGEKHNLVALFNLFLCYFWGHGVSVDDNLMQSCLMKSAESGFKPAMHNLAVLLSGSGDYRTAHQLWSMTHNVDDDGKLITTVLLFGKGKGNMIGGFNNEPLETYWKLANLSNLVVLDEDIKSIPHKIFCFTNEDH